MSANGPGRFQEGRWGAALLVLVVLAVWEGLSRSGVVAPFFFPAPSSILQALWRSIRDGIIGPHVWATLWRVALGVLLGAVPGLGLGLAMGWAPRLRALLDPIVALLHPIPKLAVMPLVMIIFGLGETSRIVVIAIGVFFPMLINAMAGVRQIPAVHFEVAEAYGGRPRDVFAHVVLPGSLPSVLTGTRLAFNIGLLLTVAVELITAQHGLGKLIWLAWQTMRTEDLYAALLVISTLGVGVNVMLERLRRRLVPWHADRSR